MNKSIFNIPVSSPGLEKAITDVINSAAMEETVLKNILDLERDIIQRAHNTAGNIEEFVSVNESVNRILRNITKLQMLMQIKLQYAEELLQSIKTFEERDKPEKSSQNIGGFNGDVELEE